jgi:hypothetical protein
MRALCDIAPFSLVRVGRRFRGAYSLHNQAARTSETLVYSETTRLYIPEDSHLQIRGSETLKSHIFIIYLWFI